MIVDRTDVLLDVGEDIFLDPAMQFTKINKFVVLLFLIDFLHLADCLQ